MISCGTVFMYWVMSDANVFLFWGEIGVQIYIRTNFESIIPEVYTLHYIYNVKIRNNKYLTDS